MGEGVKVCGIHWRKIRFLCASVITFILMVIGIVIIVIVVGTKDSKAVTVYCVLDAAAGIIFIVILRILDRASVPEDIDTTNAKAMRKEAKRRGNNGETALETTLEVVETVIETASVTADCCYSGDADGDPNADCDSCCDCSCFSD